MIIRAIDPGPVRSAYVDWDGANIIEFGIFKNEESPDASDVDVVFIEMVACYGMPVGAEVLETAYWIGRFSDFHETILGVECKRIFRRDVKLHICGDSRANDATITTAIVDRFDPNRVYGPYGKGTKKRPGMFFGFSNDIWQAFALALTAFDGIECPAPVVSR